MKNIFLAVALMLLAVPAFAGWGIQSPSAPEDDFILGPIGAVEFNPSNSNNYGLAISESLCYAKLSQGPDSNHTLVEPYGFVGLFAAADIGQWVDTNAQAAVVIDYGIMVGLPKLDVTLPEVAFSYNFRTNGFLIDAAFPADVIANVLCKKL